VFNGGSQQRAFCHVLDTVDSLVTVMDCGCTAEIFNTGNAGNHIAIGDLAHWIRDLAGSNSPVVYREGAEVFGQLYVESFNKLPNTTKIEAWTDWRPMRSLPQVLTDVHEAMTRDKRMAC
jgi:nucleoside-diphosphate-sugar epimerase